MIKIKPVIEFGQLIILISLSLAVCLLLSIYFNFWADYGYWIDTLWNYMHIDYYLDYFPYINWYHRWGLGSPDIIHYPPYIFLINAALVRLTGLEMQTVGFGIIFSSIFLASVWTGLAIRVTTGSWLLSLMGPILNAGSQTLWETKNIARGTGYHFLPLAILALVWYLKKPTRRRKIISILTLGFCTLFHPLIGLFILATTFCFLIRNLKETLSIIVPVILIALSYYLPFVIVMGGLTKVIHGPEHLDSFTDTVKSLLHIALSPYSAIIALLVFMLMIIFARKKLAPYLKPILLGSVLSVLGILFYAFGVFLPIPKFFYIAGLPHGLAMLYLTPFLALLIAISLRALTRNLPKIIFWVVGLLVILLLFSLSLLPHLGKSLKFAMVPPLYKNKDIVVWEKVEALFGPPPGENNYHFLTYHPPDYLSDFLTLSYQTPAFCQAPPRNLGGFWYGMTMDALIREGKEKFFYLDWYGIHYIFHLYDLTSLVNSKEFFTVKTYDEKGNPYGGYFNQPKPILEANASPSVLFIGPEDYQQYWIEILSWANINSSFLIPVRGSQTLQKISSEELGKFDVVWLYQYENWKNKKELKKLEDYVKKGGGLVIDTGASSDFQGENLPDPFPISQTHSVDIQDSWQMKKEPHPINEAVSFSNFSPPLYKEGEREFAWKISTISPTNLKSWAKIILTAQENPIVAVGQFGEGRVVWTGLNLPYHLYRFKNETESLFLSQMLLWAAKDRIIEPVQFTAQFVNPERREVRIDSPARGVILRQQFFQNWQVKLNQKPQKIYKAGPELIYLPLPKDLDYPSSVVFYYQISLFERSLTTISLLTIIILLIAFFKKDFPKKIFGRPFFSLPALKNRFRIKWEEE